MVTKVPESFAVDDGQLIRNQRARMVGTPCFCRSRRHRNQQTRRETKMGKQMPVESEGLGPIDVEECIVRRIGEQNVKGGHPMVEFRLRADEVKILGRRDMEVSESELEILARHYVDQLRREEYSSRFYGPDYSEDHALANNRLNTIADFLGEERYQEATASTIEEWESKVAEASAIERKLEPCKRCGAERAYEDHLFAPGGYCLACDMRCPRWKTGNRLRGEGFTGHADRVEGRRSSPTGGGESASN